MRDNRDSYYDDNYDKRSCSQPQSIDKLLERNAELVKQQYKDKWETAIKKQLEDEYKRLTST